MSIHPLGSRLGLMLRLMDGLLSELCSGFSGHTSWNWQLGLSVMDLMVLLFFCGCFLRRFSEKRQYWMVLFDLLRNQHQEAYISFRVLNFDWGFQWILMEGLFFTIHLVCIRSGPSDAPSFSKHVSTLGHAAEHQTERTGPGNAQRSKEYMVHGLETWVSNFN